MRLRSADGDWRIDVIRLSLTADGRDGEWLRICHRGFYVAEVRSVRELSRFVKLSDLQEA
ncbi:MAG: hypothetical protein ACLPN6_05950 [Streptosporangiaceae bacterium]|jgi:hypothetical protein